MPVSGQVTLRIVPVAALPHHQHANALKYGYAFLATDENGEPIETHFDQEVVITFTYDEAELLRRRIHEAWLMPAYYSTTYERWTFPEAISFHNHTVRSWPSCPFRRSSTRTPFPPPAAIFQKPLRRPIAALALSPLAGGMAWPHYCGGLKP
ncbi:MAG: hypothetical protein HGB21_14905 [Nitrospirae bacterium]|nr:hypothetical protein [Nitrospirota bacterium]